MNTPKPALLFRKMFRLFLMAALPVALLTSTAVADDTNRPTPNLAAKLSDACAVKKIDERLAALDRLGKSLELPEIPDALKAGENLKQLRERVVFSESVLKRWGELAPAQAFAHVAQMPDGMPKIDALRGIIPLYAAQDIHGAVNAAMKMRPGRARTETIQLLAEQWTKQDVKAALAWANSLPEGYPRDGALHDIYFIWVHQDPAGISSTVQNLPPGETRNALIINVAGDWAAKDATAAIKWAEALPAEADRQRALSTVAESWADVDPVAAANFALKLSPPELRQRSVLAAVARWATQDSQSAFSWMTNIQDVALQQQGVAQILNVYVPVASEAAGQCVDQLSPGPVRESAIAAYVESVRIWNPAAGTRMAMKTAEPAVREDRVHECFRTWLAWDPEAARQWLKSAELSDAVKNRWLSEKPNQE